MGRSKSKERIVAEEFIKAHPTFDNSAVADYLEIYFKYNRVRALDVIAKIRKVQNVASIQIPVL